MSDKAKKNNPQKITSPAISSGAALQNGSAFSALYEAAQEKTNCIKEIPVPGDMGTGTVKIVTSVSGCYISEWKMRYLTRQRGEGVDADDCLQFIFCYGAPLSWYAQGTSRPITLRKNSLWIYRGSGKLEQVAYEGGTDYNFKTIKMPLSYLKQVLFALFPAAEAEQTFRLLLTTYSLFPVTPRMKRLLQELFSKQTEDTTERRFYTEAKLLEFLSLVFSEFEVFSSEEACETAACSAGREPDFCKAASAPMDFANVTSAVSEAKASKANIRTDSRYLRLSKEDIAAIEQSRSLIAERFTASLSCEALAKVCGLSMSKFTKGFLLLYGVSVHQYIIRLRLELAASLLSEGAAVSETAYQVGYGNVSHFSAAFKKQYGMLPKAYRKRSS